MLWFKRISNSLTLRFSFFYGLVGLLIIVFLLGFIFIQVMGALHAQQFRQISTQSKRAQGVYESQGTQAVVHYLNNELKALYPDLWLLVDAEGNKIIGNIDRFPEALLTSDYISDLMIMVQGTLIEAKLKRVALGDRTLVVGKPLNDINDFKALMTRAGFITVILGGLFIWLSAYWFRIDLNSSLSVIRKGIQRIRFKKLKTRIPVDDVDDELNLLIKELNQMLDSLERSLNGARYVSDTITHNLRTPLTRITSYLYPLLNDTSLSEQAQSQVERSLVEIKELVRLFDKLVQISELELGVHRQSLELTDFSLLVEDLVALYLPYADDNQLQLCLQNSTPIWIHGDKDLLASALSNLLENACKYARSAVYVQLLVVEGQAVLQIEDDGIGVEAASLAKLGTHFYRDTRAHSLPGTGLGLTSVLAIVQYHRGQCEFYVSSYGGLGVRLYFALA